MSDCHQETFHIDCAGARIFVARWQPRISHSTIPVVLLHDSLGCVRTWRKFPQALALSLSRPVITYDRPGFGQSDQRFDTLPNDFVEEEARSTFPAFCQALDLTQVVLFGHSVGGGMAVAIAAANTGSDLCHAVITESAQAFVEERTLEGIRAAKARFRDPEKFAKLEKYHGKKAQWVLNAWTETWLSPEFADWQLEPLLEKVHCPLLAIHGDQDEFGSLDFPKRISDNVPGPSEMKVLAGVGHIPHREDPDEVISIVDSFLKRHEIARPQSKSEAKDEKGQILVGRDVANRPL